MSSISLVCFDDLSPLTFAFVLPSSDHSSLVHFARRTATKRVDRILDFASADLTSRASLPAASSHAARFDSGLRASHPLSREQSRHSPQLLSPQSSCCLHVADCVNPLCVELRARPISRFSTPPFTLSQLATDLIAFLPLRRPCLFLSLRLFTTAVRHLSHETVAAFTSMLFMHVAS